MALHGPVGVRRSTSRRTRPAGAPRTWTTCRTTILRCGRRRSATARGCRSSTTPTSCSTHLDPALADKGVVFGDLDAAAAEHPDLVERYLHSLVPTRPDEVHGAARAFRTGGTFLYVPRDTQVDLPLQTLTYLDADGAAVFPHTLIVVERGRRGDVHRAVRLAGPDARVQRRGHRDRTWATARTSATPRSRTGAPG